MARILTLLAALGLALAAAALAPSAGAASAEACVTAAGSTTCEAVSDLPPANPIFCGSWNVHAMGVGASAAVCVP